MAISPVFHTSATGTTAGQTVTSPTFNVLVDDAYVVFGTARGAAQVSPTCTTTIPNSTIMPIGSSSNSTGGQVAAWVILCGDGGTGRTVTVDFGVSMTQRILFVIRIPFFTYNTTWPIVQLQQLTGTTSIGWTLTSVPAASSTVLACVATQGGTPSITPANGYSELSEITTGSGQLTSEVSVMDNPGTNSGGWGGLNAASAGIAFEILAADPVVPMVTRSIAPPVGDVTVATAITSRLAQPMAIGSVIMVFASCRYVGVTTPSATITSTGLTLTGSWSTAILANDTRSVAVFAWAVTSSLASGLVTCTWGAAPDAGRIIAVGEITGQETATTPIKQTAAGSNAAAPSPFTTTLGSTPDGDSEVLGMITNYLGSTGTDVAPVAGTEIIDAKNVPAGNQLCLEVQRLTTPAAAVSWNPVNASRTAALAIEIDKLFVPTAQPHGQKVRWM